MTIEEVMAIPFVWHQGFGNVDLYRLHLPQSNENEGKKENTNPEWWSWWLFGPFQSCLPINDTMLINGLISCRESRLQIGSTRANVPSCAIMYRCKILLSHHSWNSLRTARDARQWVWPMLKHSNGSWKWKPLQWARHRGGWAGGPLKKNKKISRYVYWNYFFRSCICKSIYADTPHWPEVCILAWEGSVKQYVYIVQSNIQGFWRDKFVICGPEMINFCVITLGLGQKYQASSCQKMA